MDPHQKPPDDDACMIDVPIMEQENHENQGNRIRTTQIKQTFREAVAHSLQWFLEAKKIINTSMEWEEQEELPPQEDMAVQFSKITLDRFGQSDDYEKALFGGPWFIMDHYLMMTTWKPNFRPSINSFDNMSVWIRIEELPVEYYDKEALFEISKIIGKPIRVDYATDKVTRARFARVCVDLDLSKPLVTRVWVGGHWQSILYENLSTLCFACGKVGHVKHMCPTYEIRPSETNQFQGGEQGQKQLEIASPLGNAINTLRQKDNTIIDGVIQDKDGQDKYGPWIMIQQKRNNKSNRGKQRDENTRINEYKKRRNGKGRN
ncbi:uncharacterized protein [Spinacia oleracea]|uniref:CCHC-type domain-containing protein n=1 Tax=Spinacia oleracea TaxID=3562 RepID=A0ABM3R6U0_SPIOL|nr:uncharacterized protein LOC130466731 [Spinacia oleracea]